MIKATVMAVALLGLTRLQPASDNFLINGDAARGTQGWKIEGVATVETFLGVPCFAVRDRAAFTQEVLLPDDSEGKYVALVAKGQSDRINTDESITGSPYLYALVATPDRVRYLAYWQGQHMRGTPTYSTEWVPMWGVFKIPKGARYVFVQLQQAERKGSPQDGSVARFADVRFHIFATEDEALTFVRNYRNK